MNLLTHSFDWEKICKDLCIPFKKRSTGVLVLLCPFHNEKTPSLHMWPRSGRFMCFGCGTNGDQREFVSKFLEPPFDYNSLFVEIDAEMEKYRKLVDAPGQLFLNL